VIDIDRIMDYEAGALTLSEAVELLVDLQNAGVLNSLQGSYQRAYMDYVKADFIDLLTNTINYDAIEQEVDG